MTAELELESGVPSSAPSTSPAAALPPGAALRRARWLEERRVLGRIGRYTVLGQIAGGGMGSVFVAQMRGPAAFSRLVAIKCLHTRWLDDPKYVARFTTEVKLSTLIRHPNVVQTLDVVEESGELFLVMEYVDGVTLAALLADLGRDRRALPVPVALGILAAVLRGLHAAHEAVDHDGAPCHIVHRDVSPQNIMIGRNGHVQVLDFGAAKAVEHSQHTAAGVLVGKLAYMAPEQVRGEHSSPRTDVFAAGVVLWEALVGQRLFYEPGLDRADLLQSLVLKPVPRPSRLRADVPAAVDEVVKKALSRNPQRRYQTALEFATALEAIGAAPAGPMLAELVSELCAERLAEKDALLRAGLAAADEASASTPAPHALLVASPPSFSGMALGAAPRQVRGSRMAWLGAALLAGSALWYSFDAARTAFPRAAGAPLGPELGAPAAPREAAPEASRAFAARPTLAPEPGAASTPSTGREGEAELEPPQPETAPAAAVGSSRARRAQLPSERHQRPASGSRSRAARQRAASLHAGAGATTGRDCDPPTFIDAAGIRHYKKDCL